MVQRPRPTFPDQARANSGRVDLICVVAAGGRMTGCQIVSEQPERQGFGQAAVASMRQARIAVDPNGPQPGARIRSTISFWNGQGQPPS
ncbi:TonB family protein [Brevundimonas sp.]|uniref:TonB family protein n=1 Tax=Brevundimonas sp. TaxID=1871086 RepID=UPI004034F27A